MTFITLAESKTATKGNIVVTVTKIGDLKAGSSSARDWTRKELTLQDSSGSESMSVWNDDIKKFEPNITYKIESPYWTLYDGKTQLSLGNYATVTIAAEPSPNSMSSTPPTSDEYLKNKQTELEKEAQNFDDRMQKLILSSYINEELAKIYKDIDRLIALEHIIKSKFEEKGIELNVQKIGMYVKLVRGADNE